MALQIEQIPYNSDNYAVLLHDPETGDTACVDAGDADPILRKLSDKNWTLTQLWITHHHADHTAGLQKIKTETGCTVFGPSYSAISGIDQNLSDAETFTFAGQDVHVLHTPGHTTDMINFYLPKSGIVFTGDTLFVMGCGRLFEGTPAMMWDSLQKIMALPEDTVIYCSHEYTAANAAFALSVDQANPKLQSRAKDVMQLREAGHPTVPTTLADELATNPFLRAADPALRKALGLEGAADADVFAQIRKLKDSA